MASTSSSIEKNATILYNTIKTSTIKIKLILHCLINNSAPKIYKPFKIIDSYFAVKRQEGRFNRAASDQITEQTINKH